MSAAGDYAGGMPPPGTLQVPNDAYFAARSAGLRYVSDRRPGIRRLEAAKGFRYVGPDGEPLRDPETLARIRALAVPPAWTDVWISPIASGHIQATGRDAKGRKQYRYHARWRRARDETKYERMLAFGQALPRIRERTDADLRRPGLPRERVLAAVVRLLEETFIRVGNEEYARENKSYGLTTLRNRHVKVEGSSIRFRFRGKAGVLHDVGLRDRRLAGVVRRLQELPGQELFQFETAEGELESIDSGDVNDYLREISGGDFTAKDFRTWGGTVLAYRALLALQPADTKTAAKRNVVEAIKEVADGLGNTPAVARKSYVHPAVLDAYFEGSVGEALAEAAEEQAEPPAAAEAEEEEGVLDLLRQRIGQSEGAETASGAAG